MLVKTPLFVDTATGASPYNRHMERLKPWFVGLVMASVRRLFSSTTARQIGEF